MRHPLACIPLIGFYRFSPSVSPFCAASLAFAFHLPPIHLRRQHALRAILSTPPPPLSARSPTSLPLLPPQPCPRDPIHLAPLSVSNLSSPVFNLSLFAPPLLLSALFRAAEAGSRASCSFFLIICPPHFPLCIFRSIFLFPSLSPPFHCRYSTSLSHSPLPPPAVHCFAHS